MSGIERAIPPSRKTKTKMKTITITLTSFSLTITKDNTGNPAAYVNNSQESTASGEEAILASYLEDARNAGAEDELYAAIAAAK